LIWWFVLTSRKYYLANRERCIEASRAYYRLHRDEVLRKQKERYWVFGFTGDRKKSRLRETVYVRANVRYGSCVYAGMVDCPVCGLRGEKSYQRLRNIKTGVFRAWATVVMHRHRESGKRIYDGKCYVGVGRL